MGVVAAAVSSAASCLLLGFFLGVCPSFVSIASSWVENSESAGRRSLLAEDDAELDDSIVV